MPGFEVIGIEEKRALDEIFEQSAGVLFAHGFDALRNGRFRVRELERAFAQTVMCPYAQAVTSGTMAQYVAMKAFGIGSGDEVITQAFTFVATVETVIAIGADPVIVDVDDTFNMAPAALERAITKKTKLIIPVHMLGNPADMAAINAIAKKHGIPVLEDACEAIGASYQGRSVGSLGDAAVFSLDFGKTITTGEGGMITTARADLFKYCREYHDHGHQNNSTVPRGRDTRDFAGLNLRMTEMQGAIGLAQIPKLDMIVGLNRRNKAILKNRLQSCAGISFRRLTDPAGDAADTLIFSFEMRERCERLVKKLAESKIGTKNVPDALDWHFAGTWSHMFPAESRYATNWSTAWKPTADLLYRSVALPIMVLRSEKEMHDYAERVARLIDATP